ncbi:MAG: serine/threonine-protein kinase [Acidobacteriales bacterium]|nr:serine/threonine-protein kinase [Terriglobales bacterium]
MPLPPGTRLGPYEIQSAIGAGGMGEVYRARDTRLGRDVAVKILSESFARDPDRLQRFEQEARAVAALNHPNILGIFDIGSQDGSPYLVSELLEGQSLREMLQGGPLPSRKTIDFGVQIASGLAAAHEKGIIHRDLKPENLFITRGGRAKILDFGLAKLTQSASLGKFGSDALTLTSSPTQAGVVMGTAGYMSPEQVRGDVVDHRTDIFSFGAVLYEMISGHRAFHRDTAAETMTAIMKEDPPDLSGSARLVSPALDRTVNRCLEKRPEQRFQSAQDLAFALGSLSGSDTSGAMRAAIAPSHIRRWLWASAALALVSLIAVVGLLLSHSAPPAVRMQFSLPVPGEVSQTALSADGQMLAFVSPNRQTGAPSLFVQRIGSPTAVELPGTEGVSYPFWSPDDAYVAFFAKGRLFKMPASGGSPQVLAVANLPRGGAWGARNVIVYTPESQGGLRRVNADGTGDASITTVGTDEQSHRWPVFLPGGKRFLFWVGNFRNSPDDRTSGIYQGAIDSKEKKLVVLAHSTVGVANGQIFYADEKRQLVASTFDMSKGTISEEPRVVAESVGFQPSIVWAAFSSSLSGNLVFSTNTQSALSALTWVDRTGKELGRVGEPGTLSNPILSPDGKRVAVDIADLKANNVDVWLESLQGGSNSRFTFDPSEEAVGLWSRDGQKVAYRSVSALSKLLTKAASGLEREKTLALVDNLGDILPNSWTLDDKQILCTMFFPRRTATHASGLVLVPAEGGAPVPFAETTASARNGQISPDGKWVAYASNESGDWEIYVTTFPGGEGKWQISRGSGTEPRWRGDGKEIFYIGQSGMMMAATVSTDGTFSSGTPASLFPVRGRAFISSTDTFTYDVAKDGQRFLVNRYLSSEHPNPLTIILNATSAEAK